MCLLWRIEDLEWQELGWGRMGADGQEEATKNQAGAEKGRFPPRKEHILRRREAQSTVTKVISV